MTEAPKDGWLIYKAGRGWYRPNAEGYTNDIAKAGRYSKIDALAYSHPNGPIGPRDGMSIMHEDEADPWRCVGCGKVAPGRIPTCSCPTGLLHRKSDMEIVGKVEDPHKVFMRWVNEGPALAKAAGVYVGIRIYESEDAARQVGDIS